MEDKLPFYLLIVYQNFKLYFYSFTHLAVKEMREADRHSIKLDAMWL